jgi:hypothetical protein
MSKGTIGVEESFTGGCSINRLIFHFQVNNHMPRTIDNITILIILKVGALIECPPPQYINQSNMLNKVNGNNFPQK